MSQRVKYLVVDRKGYQPHAGLLESILDEYGRDKWTLRAVYVVPPEIVRFIFTRGEKHAR